MIFFMSSTTAAQMPARKVVVIRAAEREAEPVITLVGTVDAARRSRVASEMAGIVAEVPVRQGDYVASGGVLCRLDDESLSLRVAEARAQLQAREARYAELRAGTRKEELARLKALADEAAADLERWTLEIERVTSLYEGKDSNAKEVYDTRAGFLAAEQRSLAAQAAYRLGVEGPRAEEIAQVAAQVAEQRAVLSRLERELAKAVIKIPFDGFVTQLLTEIGQWLSAGGEVVEVVDLATALVRVNVPESALPYVSVGETVRIKVDALSRAVEGRVKHVIPQADRAARTFPVEIEVNNAEQRLAVGMFARAALPAGNPQRVVAVPKDAVVEREGTDYVAVVTPGHDGKPTGMLLPVVVGGDIGDWIAVSSGNIAEGAVVVIRGNENMLPFPQEVQIVDPIGRPAPWPEEPSESAVPSKAASSSVTTGGAK